MSVLAVTMRQHASAPPVPAVGARVVLSRLGPGETLVGSPAPSIKMLLEGEEVYRIDGRTHRLSPGRLLFVDRGEPCEVTVRRTAPTRGMCIYLPTADASSDRPDLGLLGRTSMRALGAHPLGNALREAAVAAHDLGEGWERHAPGILDCAQSILNGSLPEAVEHLARLNLKKDGTRRDVLMRIEAARAHLHENPTRSVPLAELAGVAGLSAFHLARYFAAAFGMPPARYHRSLRMALATKLLRSDAHSPTEVAEMVGYAELSAFSHAYKREFGRPPSVA